MNPSSDLLRVDALDPVAVLRAALRRRRLVVGIMLLAMLGGALVTLIHKRTYTARAGIRPTNVQSAAQMSAAGTVAALGGSTVPPELDYYVDLIESRTVLEHVAGGRYTSADRFGRREVSVADALGISNRDGAALALEEAIATLRAAITINADPRTRIIRIFVRTPSPSLSEQILAGIVVQLDQLDSRLRRTEAGQDRSFYAVQRSSLETELRSAEGELQRFRERNRGSSYAAGLSMQDARLMARVEQIRGQVVELEQQEFQAKIRAARTAPSFTLIEPPIVPALADSRRLGTNLAFAMVTGLLFGLYAAFILDRVSAGRTHAVVGGR